MILCTWGLTKYRETTTVVSAVVVVAFLFPQYLFVNYTLFFFSIVSESNQMLILNLTTFNFFSSNSNSYCYRCFNLKSSSICIYFLCRCWFLSFFALHIIQRRISMTECIRFQLLIFRVFVSRSLLLFVIRPPTLRAREKKKKQMNEMESLRGQAIYNVEAAHNTKI